MENQRDCWKEIIEEMEGRRVKGLLDYGKPVNADESEDWIQHAIYEFLDGAVYCKAAGYVISDLRQEITRLTDKVNALLVENAKLKTELNRINSEPNIY